ncbi:hypothetical protein BIW11_05938 [Tropilaelaps mercedesae]|uniref:Uncharacterized protein n=1 Tax=Tropilaelaps mercedesae TaxID=418985 RepID=A0A1V9Y076_9ACAR|nr:hypothetical protein BIW11_05938 [Tropilaelaps mercedesae]
MWLRPLNKKSIGLLYGNISSSQRRAKELQRMLVVILCVLGRVWSDADRIIEQFNIVVDKLASDPQRATVYKSVVAASRPCIEPLSHRVGDDEVERLIESIVPMAERCIAAYGTSQDIDHKRAVFRECSNKELSEFVRPLSTKGKQSFLEVKICVRDLLVPS